MLDTLDYADLLDDIVFDDDGEIDTASSSSSTLTPTDFPSLLDNAASVTRTATAAAARAISAALTTLKTVSTAGLSTRTWSAPSVTASPRRVPSSSSPSSSSPAAAVVRRTPSSSRKRVPKPPPDGMPIFGHIYVDTFKYGLSEDAPAGCSMPKYFLTHFHTDHYGGISKTWKDKYLYCTPVTANLVVANLGVDPKWVIPLSVDPTTANDIGDGASVTVFDANHCPGSAMFLFRRKGESVFYTGDFRYNPGMALPDTVRIDTLHVDSTYCDSTYELPSQESVENNILDIIRQNGDSALYVIGAYTIGKERIIFRIIEEMKKCVYVDQKRYENYKHMELPQNIMRHITTDPNATNIHVAFMPTIKPSAMAATFEEKYGSKYSKVICFKPTGWAFKGCCERGATAPLKKSGRCTIYELPYSEHSAYGELLSFVKRINPRKIIPFATKDPEAALKVLTSVLASSPSPKPFLLPSPSHSPPPPLPPTKASPSVHRSDSACSKSSSAEKPAKGTITQFFTPVKPAQKAPRAPSTCSDSGKSGISSLSKSPAGNSRKILQSVTKNAATTSHYFVSPGRSTSTFSLSSNNHDSVDDDDDDDFEEGGFPVFDEPQQTKKTRKSHTEKVFGTPLAKRSRTVSSYGDDDDDGIIDLTL